MASSPAAASQRSCRGPGQTIVAKVNRVIDRLFQEQRQSIATGAHELKAKAALVAGSMIDPSIHRVSLVQRTPFALPPRCAAVKWLSPSSVFLIGRDHHMGCFYRP